MGQVARLGSLSRGTRLKKATSVRLESFSETDFDRLITRDPSPAFLLQWAGPLFTFPPDRAQSGKYLAACEQEPPVTLAFRAVNEANGWIYSSSISTARQLRATRVLDSHMRGSCDLQTVRRRLFYTHGQDARDAPENRSRSWTR